MPAPNDKLPTEAEQWAEYNRRKAFAEVRRKLRALYRRKAEQP